MMFNDDAPFFAAPPEWDAILTASMKNDSLGIRHLVEEQGVSPSHANAVAQSALHIASLWGNLEAVEELIRHKAAINVANKLTGATPLHCAAQSIKGEKERRVLCMKRLIAAGADPAVVDIFGKAPVQYCQDDPVVAKVLQLQPPALFQAIDDCQLEEVQRLLAVPTNGNSYDKPPIYEETFMGETPLQHTFNLLFNEEGKEGGDRAKLVRILKALLEAGANINAEAAKDNTNSNPMEALEDPVLPPLHRVCEALQTAYKNEEDATLLEETCRLLIQHRATVTPELTQLLHTAGRKNEVPLARLLIQVVNIDPNAKGRQGMTPLQFAARSGRTEMVRYLLSLPSIDVAVEDDRGQTALAAAKVNNKEEVVALLEAFANQK